MTLMMLMGVAWLKSGKGQNKKYGPVGDETKNMDENFNMVMHTQKA